MSDPQRAPLGEPYPGPMDPIILDGPDLAPVPSLYARKSPAHDMTLQYQLRSIALADLMDRTDAIEIYIEPSRVNRSRFDSITIEEDECGGLKVTRVKMGS